MRGRKEGGGDKDGGGGGRRREEVEEGGGGGRSILESCWTRSQCLRRLWLLELELEPPLAYGGALAVGARRAVLGHLVRPQLRLCLELCATGAALVAVPGQEGRGGPD